LDIWFENKPSGNPAPYLVLPHMLRKWASSFFDNAEFGFLRTIGPVQGLACRNNN
jgi:hypothetical protein